MIARPDTGKQHYLNQLQETYARWQDLLAGLAEARITASDLPSGWSIKDEVAHLMAWQQITNARLQAALHDREPVFSDWPEGLDPEDDEQTEAINAWIYAAHRGRDWASVYADWETGFQHVLEAVAAIPESDLLEVGRYAWIEGYPLAAVLEGTIEHHREHYEHSSTSP